MAAGRYRGLFCIIKWLEVQDACLAGNRLDSYFHFPHLSHPLFISPK